MGGSYRFGAVEVRADERELRVRGERVAVGPRAFDLLLALIERRGRVVPKNELLDAVWPDIEVGENNLAAQVVALRKAIGPNAIATIPGRGYQWTLLLDDQARPDPSPEVVQSNLPSAVGVLIGRDADLRAVTEMTGRLIQIVGPGGIGKTHLALELARHGLAGRAHDVAWVDFAAISSAERIVSTIASAARARLADGGGTAELARAMAGRQMLLVLDNCEHLASEIGVVVSTILPSAAGVRILVTSREVLRCAGSTVYRLGPLEVPPPGSTFAQAREFAAIQLLEQRAREVESRFRLSEETIAEARTICERIDGIPLALEMAGARLPLMGVGVLAAHLDRHLTVLRNPNAGTVERHRTMRATLEWSHSLLSDDERLLLRYLSAFEGTFRLDAAESVAAAVGLVGFAAIDVLAALVDKSLVQLESAEPPRYRLLDTTRSFAREQLNLHGEEAAAWALHDRSMMAVAEEATASQFNRNVQRWLAAYLPDYNDLQAAFDRALEHRDPHVLAVSGEALRILDFERDIEREARGRKEATRVLLPYAPPLEKAMMLSALGMFRFIVLEGMNRVEIATECVAAWKAVGNARRHCRALYSLALHLAGAGRFDQAMRAIEEGREVMDPKWPVPLLLSMKNIEAQVGHYCRDERLIRSACDVMLRMGWESDPRMDSNPRYLLARLSLVVGDEDPVRLLEAVTSDLRRRDRPRMLSFSLAVLCSAFVKVGEPERARRAISEALSVGSDVAASYAIDHMALFASTTGHAMHSAGLLGFNDAMYARAQDRRQWTEGWAAEEAQARNESLLGVDAARRLRVEGSSLSQRQAIALAAELVPECA